MGKRRGSAWVIVAVALAFGGCDDAEPADGDAGAADAGVGDAAAPDGARDAPAGADAPVAVDGGGAGAGDPAGPPTAGDAGPGGSPAGPGGSPAGPGGSPADAGLGGSPADAGRPRDGGAAASCAFDCPRWTQVAALCVPTGACTTQTTFSAPSAQVNSCYANGVKMLITTNLGGGPMAATTMRVTRPDGSTCYTLDVAGPNDGTRTLVYRDGAGFAVVNGTIDPDGRISVTCEGRTFELSSQCPGADVGTATGQGCAPGTCQ